LRAAGARNPHVHLSTLRFLRAVRTQPPFARYAFGLTSSTVWSRCLVGLGSEFAFEYTALHVA
jgi:hypothetical protein